MYLCPSSLKRRVAVVVAAIVVAHGAGAQQTIIFSKPAGDVAEKANSFMPAPSQMHGGSGAFNAPSSLFSAGPAADSFDVLPGLRAPATISPEEAKRWQKVLEAKKNWTLLTPEEILGVPTAEQILGIPDPKDDGKMTLEERFLARQTHETATNGRPIAALLRPDSPDNPFRPRDENENDRPFNQGNRSQPGSTPGSPKNFNQFLNATPATPFGSGSDPKVEAPWTSPFDRPAPVAKPDLAQEAAMERFRALMEPSSPPDKITTETRFAPVPGPDPNMQPLPPVNALGHSFTPIQSGISRPTGIMPLPGITSPYALPASPKPAGQAQRPPWLSDSPSPFSPPPTRVF